MTEEQPESLLPVPNPDEKANIESDVEEKSPIEHYEEALTVPQIITQFNVMIMENQMPFNIFRGHKSSSSNANSDPMSPHHVVNCQEKVSGIYKQDFRCLIFKF
ncbi:hypothetical protein RF11_09794 [Thelohanellus kitauei]|uniref:Uncharacterized protein n=1 Tax=Thelohanellus kitauei TaxID=669202 RepID=A0A0C2N0U2_THEKT|nr:hypothetical protein RF11_09794 [Thelohanellus kitauei]